MGDGLYAVGESGCSTPPGPFLHEVTLHICAGAGHSQSFGACAEDYPDWVLGFLEHALGSDG